MSEVKMVEHVIDCDADPFVLVPSGWKVKKHQKGGFFKWDPSAVQFYLSEPQRNGKIIEGNKLRKELTDKPVLNANVLDYLLSHPHLIPEEWKQDSEGRARHIFFWGTIYRDSGGHPFVRFLYYWPGVRWGWRFSWLDRGWDVRDPAALRAN